MLIAIARHTPDDLKRFASYLYMMGNWYIVHHGWSLDNPLEPLWSISVEEQFYLIWPLVIALTGELGAWISAVFFALLSIGVTFHLANTGAQLDSQIWCNSFVQFLMFAAGILFALGLKGRMPELPNWLRCLFPPIAFALWFFSVAVLRTKTYGYAQGGFAVPLGYVLTAIGCILLCASLLGVNAKMPSALVYLGKISFGLYVFHLLASQLVAKTHIHHDAIFQKPLALGLTILLASISYRYFETPFLRIKNRRAIIHTRPE
ncbi:acyltransferase family protein [Silvibacterium dinghuense]|uniref:Acyltransferase n=1 Tax=Silvibacterium dinghuense TaxID=1560006 RepID=A0A4V1NVC4_9BACT|nr:acyltransferase [Silvibacterium dinghuense]RXS95280.1 acyltransferase [Silvibacterium dinghuense]